jgi:Tol biopolymer transport system component
VMNADGTDQIRLTSGPEEHGGPVWSPDGTKIAYDTQSAPGAANPTIRDIYVMDANGLNQSNLTGYESSITLSVQPDWSPDGSKIAFAAYSSLTSTTAPNIHVMNADGSNITVIDSGYNDAIPSWSSDSSKIAFFTSRDGGHGDSEVFIMDSDGSNPMNISNNPVVFGVDNSGWESDPSWSPDGNKIAFASHRSGFFDIWVMDADGSNQVNLTDQPTYDASPAWSPDSTKIAFMSDRSGDSEIYVMNADGSSPVKITNSPGSDGSPSWGIAAPGAAPMSTP